MASFADARAQAGIWQVRIEDLDRARERPGAAAAILRTLEAFGFEWDGAVRYQSRRLPIYAEALAALETGDFVFPCACSRREIAQLGSPGPEGPVYPGTCREGLAPGRGGRTLRLRAPQAPIGFRDRIQGEIVQDIAKEVGDFVLRRADGIPAYQLAVVVDDAWQEINQVVRGADLMASTPRQILVQQALGLPTPGYAHIPLVRDGQGRKLSKSEAAAPVAAGDPRPALLRAWAFLGQVPLAGPPTTPAEFWAQAIERWDPGLVPAHDRGANDRPSRA